MPIHLPTASDAPHSTSAITAKLDFASQPVLCEVIRSSPRDLECIAPVSLPLTSSHIVHGTLTWQELAIPFSGEVHLLRQREKHYEAGLFLRERLPAELLDVCWSDMRAELRYSVVIPVSAKLGSHSQVCAATLKNYSRSGFLLVSDIPATVGSRVDLIIDNDVVVRGRVRWTKECYTGHQIGCQLLPRHVGALQQRRLELRTSIH